ncbi:hypothetical protein TWF696_002972 [Orbilia brochopaga]|uniref:Uncharacterized protein n=1 Tax=Orbilia brochopaga TaxID=3140254 RepID=A0AAV9TZC5_9PEZI
MSVAKEEVPSKRQRSGAITPGLPTPLFPDGGWFTIKSTPITITGSKEQIIQTLLRFEAYHTWNNFIPRTTDIVDPDPHDPTDPAASTSQTQPSKDRRVGTTMTFYARMFASLPFLKVKSSEEITTINKEKGIIAWRARHVECERVHVITEADEYGTCRYESFETFQKTPMTVAIRALLSLALQMRFDEWSRDLKAAVEAQNW